MLKLLYNVMNLTGKNPSYIQISNTRTYYHESALMTAAHILVCLTQEGKSIEEIAREDFDNNLEQVTVWVDYMAAINWICKDHANNNDKWIATDNGKEWVEKIVQHIISR